MRYFKVGRWVVTVIVVVVLVVVVGEIRGIPRTEPRKIEPGCGVLVFLISDNTMPCPAPPRIV